MDSKKVEDSVEKVVDDSLDGKEEESEDKVGGEEYVKHPLQNAWTLWFFKNDRTKGWEENQKEIITVDTVEDFWSLYNHIELASRLTPGCDYSIFKKGIKPMWEDDHNRKGGRWLINLDKKQRSTCLDDFWLEVMLCLIGDTFNQDSELVNGAVVNIRNKGDKIAMWLCDSKQGESILKIGSKMKERLGIDAKVKLGFEAHQDTMNKSGSTAKNKYVV